jgi:hypothetical protein
LRCPRHHRDRRGDGRRLPAHQRCGVRRQGGLASARRGRGGCGIGCRRTWCGAWRGWSARRRSSWRRWRCGWLAGARRRRRRLLALQFPSAFLRRGGRRWRRRRRWRGRARWGRRRWCGRVLRRRRGWCSRMLRRRRGWRGWALRRRGWWRSRVRWRRRRSLPRRWRGRRRTCRRGSCLRGLLGLSVRT